MIKWVKFGYECTEFFHANASIKNRRNTITSLVSDGGREVFNHDEKATLLWNSFKKRQGKFEFGHMYLDLQSLIVQVEGLEILDISFTREEIDKIIAYLPNHKSLGPDGFNGEFLKKCWPIILQDFYELCESFASRDICLRSINDS